MLRMCRDSESFSIESVVSGYHLGDFGSFDFLTHCYLDFRNVDLSPSANAASLRLESNTF